MVFFRFMLGFPRLCVFRQEMCKSEATLIESRCRTHTLCGRFACQGVSYSGTYPRLWAYLPSKHMVTGRCEDVRHQLPLAQTPLPTSRPDFLRMSSSFPADRDSVFIFERCLSFLTSLSLSLSLSLTFSVFPVRLIFFRLRCGATSPTSAEWWQTASSSCVPENGSCFFETSSCVCAGAALCLSPRSGVWTKMGDEIPISLED